MTANTIDFTRRQRLILLVVSGAAFLDLLDTTVVNLAFPALGRDFSGATVSDLTWVITGYAVLFAALLTAAGRLADVIGRRRVFVVGVVLFTASSLASAVAPSLAALIVARFVQGAGAALTLPSGLGIILAETPPQKRAAAVGIWGAAAGASAAIGPTLGGLLVDLVSWRAVFLINVPLGLAIAWVAWRHIAAGARAAERLPDPLGIALLAGGIGLIVLGVSKGYDWGWGSGATLMSLVSGLVLTAAALLRGHAHPAPALEVGMWRNLRFASSNLASFWFGAAAYPMMLVSVLFLTQVWHYSELDAGLAVSPGAISGAVAAVIAGRVGDRYGQRLPAIFGALALVATDLWILVALGPHRDFLSLWLWLNLLSGIGLGTASVALSSAAAIAAPAERFAVATGMNLTTRQVGGAIGIAALAVILQSKIGLGSRAYVDVYGFAMVMAGIAAASALGVVARENRVAEMPAAAPQPTGGV